MAYHRVGARRRLVLRLGERNRLQRACLAMRHHCQRLLPLLVPRPFPVRRHLPPDRCLCWCRYHRYRDYRLLRLSMLRQDHQLQVYLVSARSLDQRQRRVHPLDRYLRLHLLQQLGRPYP